MRIPACVALIFFAILPAAADDVPFAQRPAGQPNVAELRSLGDTMGLIQMRHIKLWFAGKSENWALAKYEIGQMRDALVEAAMHYQNIPVEFVVAGGKPLLAMQDAATSKDGKKFEQDFADLTAACNNCHQAGQVGFITIHQPTSWPFADQTFEPAR